MTAPESVLILAAHGSSHERAKTALAGFSLRVRNSHPGLRVLVAHTASQSPHSHRSGPCMKEVLETLSPATAPAVIAVQSLHVIAGGEFDRMSALCLEFASRTGSDVRVAGPLLACTHDAPLVAKALAGSITECITHRDGPTRQTGGADEAIVLMGHGTTHAAQQLYRALAARLALERPLTYLGVLEAVDPHNSLSVQAIIRTLTARNIRRARLVPFLTVAGRHAHNDLAGPEPGSWKSILAGHGIESTPDLTGLVERDAFARLWLDSIATLMGLRPKPWQGSALHPPKG